MGRIRTIKPEIALHEGLFDAEQETGLPLRFVFAVLPTHCDKEGRFEWRPRRMKPQLLPYDDVDMSRVLDALRTRGFLVQYRVGDRWFGCIPTFHKHQVINNKERSSELPAVEDADEVVSEEKQEVVNASTTRARRDNDATTTREVNSQEEVEREVERERKGKEGIDMDHSAGADGPSAPTPAPAKTYDYPEDFERAWALYPPRSGNNPKRAAFKAWNARRKEGRSADEMEQGLRRYARWIDIKGLQHTDKVMRASTFFGPDEPFTQAFTPPAAERSGNQAASEEAKRRFWARQNGSTS